MACAAWNGGSDRSVLELTSILGYQKASRRLFFRTFCQKREKKESPVFLLYFNRGIHATLSLLLYAANLDIVVHVFQTLGFFLPTFVYTGEDLSVRNQNLEGLLDDVLAKNHLGRTTELPQWSDLLQLSRQTFFCNDGISATGEVATCFFLFFQNKDGHHCVGTCPESSFCWNLLLFSSPTKVSSQLLLKPQTVFRNSNNNNNNNNKPSSHPGMFIMMNRNSWWRFGRLSKNYRMLRFRWFFTWILMWPSVLMQCIGAWYLTLHEVKPQENIHHVEMYVLLKMGIFQCHVSFQNV